MASKTEETVVRLAPGARSRWTQGQCRIVDCLGHILGAVHYDRGRPFCDIEEEAWQNALAKMTAEPVRG